MQEYRNKRIVVRYDKEVCTHSGNCVRGLPAVFNTHNKPWINVDGAEAKKIIETVRKCPSGALTFETLEENSP